jgi:hypothetical protein
MVSRIRLVLIGSRFRDDFHALLGIALLDGRSMISVPV